jgi:hypothetical protein
MKKKCHTGGGGRKVPKKCHVSRIIRLDPKHYFATNMRSILVFLVMSSSALVPEMILVRLLKNVMRYP